MKANALHLWACHITEVIDWYNDPVSGLYPNNSERIAGVPKHWTEVLDREFLTCIEPTPLTRSKQRDALQS
jgi:hypothetical protein